jgi:hypothetical protein
MQAQPETSLSVYGKWKLADWGILLALLFFTLFLAVTLVRWHGVPAEDSLMLLRYANHLAAGQGITWNAGEHPVEGATDFLFLIVVALTMKVSHLGAIHSARLVLAASHLAGVAFLYIATRRVLAAHPAVAAVLSLYLAIGPGIIHCTNGFSAPFYGLMAMVAWAFALTTVTDGQTLQRAIGFACFALLTGLTRPDGVLLAIFMCVALLYALRSSAKQILLVTFAVFLVLGGTYFLWRLHYFGHLLPNPFYKKGGGHLYPFSLKGSVDSAVKMLLPVLPIYALGLVAPRARRRTIFALIPIVGFAMIWVLLTDENNLGMRFQYPILPLGLLSTPLVLAGLGEEAKARGWTWPADASARAVNVAATVLVFCSVLMSSLWWRPFYLSSNSVPGSGAYRIATGLAQWKDRHYTIVATEAGAIPYFSQWRAIDGYGLNDEEVAHNPAGISDAYLDSNHPAVIMFAMMPSQFIGKQGFYQAWRGDPPARRDVSQVQAEMSHYAVTHDYELAARWGSSPCAVLVWYVKRGLPESQEMIDLIRQKPFFDPYVPGAPMDDNFLGGAVDCDPIDVRVDATQ